MFLWITFFKRYNIEEVTENALPIFKQPFRFMQVVSACHGGNVICWMIDTGQKVKTISETHGSAEITALAQDHSETRLFTGSTDGCVKVRLVA